MSENHEVHVTHQTMDLVQVQADAMYVKLQKRLVVWMAMAAGLSAHCWSVGELLSYRFAPPLLVEKKRRGRRPRSEAQRKEGRHQLVTG